MRKLALTGLLVALACGGGSGANNNNNNGTPGLKTFSYGSPQAPTNAQKNTANNAQTQMNNAVQASVHGQVSNAASLPSMTDSLAGSLPNLIAVPDDPAATAGEVGSLLGHRSEALNQGCYTYTSSSITYNNCTIGGSGFNETLNGSLTVNGGTVTWNLTVTYAYSAQNVTSNGTYNWTGQLVVTESTIVGQGRSSFSGHVVSGSVTYDYQYTAGFDANLTYQTSPSYCITGGTLEIRRTLNGTTNQGSVPVHDAGAKYTWTGCGAVTVATGT
ncbi:MAG TPA: hypothetical protein VFF12_15080 [Myxococcaceae bacterium]|nr:hypothetical protein [Myxococcaceae bacterium]